MKRMVRALLGVLALAVVPAVAGAQSLSYNSGQNVAPAYEGWEEDADGSKYFLFGYMNRNWEEEIDVPVGAGNAFSPGPADLGQPTHFLPRRNRFIFRVKVPASFTEKDELIWTLTSNGETEKAYASLRTDYKVDDVVKASETGALGAGSSSPEVRANKAPLVKVEGPTTLTAKVGQPVKISAIVTDDGVPKNRGTGRAGAAVQNRGTRNQDVLPEASESAARANRATQPPARATVGKSVGLHISWIHFRGPGTVTFDPVQIKAWEDTRAGANSPWAPIWVAPPMPADGRLPATATFSAPGTYVIRGIADDGALLGWDDVTVTVTN